MREALKKVRITEGSMSTLMRHATEQERAGQRFSEACALLLTEIGGFPADGSLRIQVVNVARDSEGAYIEVSVKEPEPEPELQSAE